MRNLLLFLWKNNFTLAFLILFTFCMFLLVQRNAYQRTSFINSSNDVSGNVLRMYANANEYLDLKYVNQQLATENALLHTLSSSSLMNTSANHYTVNDSLHKQKYEYIQAKVVNNSTNRRNNYLTLDKGSLMGVKPDMAIITSSGAVGTVIGVSQNFCSVMSLLHKDTRISAKLKKDGSFGPLSWEGDDYRIATLTDIPNHVQLKKGDTIVTSAYSSTYPENILLGTIDSYEIKSGEPFYTIQVRLSTQFKKLSQVYIINNIYKTEQDTLEKRTQIDKP